jgi:hypothetical protein
MIRVQNLEAALAAVGLDLESFALTARLSSHDAVTLAAGGALRATEATVRRVASALSMAEGEILVTEHEGTGEGEMMASASSPSRRDEEPDDGRSPLDHVVDRVCAEDGYTEEERDIVVSVLGAGTFPTHLTRSEIPAFLRVWFVATRELYAANALTHEALIAKVRAEGPRAAARMAEGIEKAMRASTARGSARSTPAKPVADGGPLANPPAPKRRRAA